jgi:hypothetical protein
VYKLVGFVNGDLKLQSEACGHAGASCNSPCIHDEVKLQELDDVWNINTPKRTLSSLKECRTILEQHLKEPQKKKVLSCSNCGGIGHYSRVCKMVKQIHVCETCGEVGHCKNSNNNQQSGRNTTAANADCKQWTKEIQQIMMQIAQQEVGFVDLDLHKTKGIKSVEGLFEWIPRDRWVPPFLHIVTLGNYSIVWKRFLLLL